MDVVIVNQDEVRQLLAMAECIEVMKEALEALARGHAVQPLRTITWLPDRSGALGLMPGHLDRPSVLGVKVVTVFPENLNTEYESHQGSVLLFDAEKGCLRALVDAGEVTRIRTAAVSAVATRLLARQDASDLAILGSGAQAGSHLEAMLLVRRIERVRVWSRNLEHAQIFARQASQQHPIDVEPVAQAADAARNADIICTTTGAREPVLLGEWVSPGAHINAVGACFPAARELDSSAVMKSRLYVDRRESAMAEAGDFLIPKSRGEIGDDHVRGELGEALMGRVQGRSSPDDITLFKSLGLAVEDLAASHHTYAKAIRQGVGTNVPIGGLRHEAT